MRFRYKLLILMMLISLVPMLVMRLGFVRNVRLLGDRIVKTTSEQLVNDAEDRLRVLVDCFSKLLRSESSKLRAVVLFQAQEVEAALAAAPVNNPDNYIIQNARIYHEPPPNAENDPRYYRRSRTGEILPLEISYRRQVFQLKPGLQERDAAKDIARLSSLTPVYSKLTEPIRNSVLWQFTTLENGLHSTYPAHGYTPLMMDARNLPGYKWATSLARDTGSLPYVDPATRQVVVSVSSPVNGPDGKFAGVTGLSIPMRVFLGQGIVVNNIPAETNYYVGFIAKDEKSDRRRIMLAAGVDYMKTRHRSWRLPMDPEWLISSDKIEYEKVMDDFERGVGNSRRLPYKGRDSLWVYGPALKEGDDIDGYLILITPYDRIIEPAVEMEKNVAGLIDNLMVFAGYAFGIMAFIAILLSLRFSRTVTKPLQLLVKRAQSLADGDFEAKTDIRSRDEFGDVGRVFDSVGPQLEERYMMSQSLALAMEVQQSLLPKKPPRLDGFDIAGRVIYCDETGGDYFDYIDALDGSISVVVGDVSGHGIQSALLMSSARAFLRQRSAISGDLAGVLGDVNRQLSLDIGDSGQFITMFCCRINPENKRMYWICAGHSPVFIYDSIKDEFCDLEDRSLALGVLVDYQYNERYLDLERGQIVIIGTDGIPEAHNDHGEMFGREKLKSIVRDNAQKTAEEIISGIVGEVDEFRQGAPQEDDITMVVVKVL